MTAALYIIAGTALLAVLALGFFAVLVGSIRRAPRVPLSQIKGKQAGTISRRVLVGFRLNDGGEDE